MIRIFLLVVGVLMLLFQQYIQAVSYQAQTLVFVVGVLLLGVPHGSADLLVAMQNADSNQKQFSKWSFFANYLGRLLIFALIIRLFPLIGNLLFIFLAAAHFGETDLYRFKTNTFLGKAFSVSYGLVILSVILLHHFEEVRPILLLFDVDSQSNAPILSWIGESRYTLMSWCVVLFFVCGFLYFSKNKHQNQKDVGKMLLHFVLIVLLIYYLPMLLGFTFYFVIWHSVLSLKNIIIYLQGSRNYSAGVVAKQIFLYSSLAMIGIFIFGITGFMFVSNNALMGYLFLGLAVLTAPHTQIMHDMYHSIRTKQMVVEQKLG